MVLCLFNDPLFISASPLSCNRRVTEGSRCPFCVPLGVSDSDAGRPLHQVAQTGALIPLAHSFTVALSRSCQTVGWMASHFDDLCKQFVRSATSCTYLIQNINVCCRCNFSCQLMHQEKMTFIPERCNFFTSSNLQCPDEANQQVLIKIVIIIMQM